MHQQPAHAPRGPKSRSRSGQPAEVSGAIAMGGERGRERAGGAILRIVMERARPFHGPAEVTSATPSRPR
jgi:hypothetical protein